MRSLFATVKTIISKAVKAVVVWMVKKLFWYLLKELLR